MSAVKLPVDAVLPDLLAALTHTKCAIVIAPPGAGKTTRVPPALQRADWCGDRRVIVLEPRRLAARAAARRMAVERGEKTGDSVGYRVRFDTKIGPATRIEAVTPGIFTRMIQNDPELTGVAAVIFDEFHERNLESDLALALSLDTQGGLRDDLRIVIMSATLDADRLSAMLDGAPVIECRGKWHPVTMDYRPRAPNHRVEAAVADACRSALVDHDGGILAFLPGQAEIRRTAEGLADRLPPKVDIRPLYGALDIRDQDQAVRPAEPGRRKVVLATSIAEASITIEDVRVVIDSGLARRPRFEPATGLTRLETVRASKAAIDQRRGRAGRVAPGHCIRLWHEGQTRSLDAYDRPEILEADLAGLVLDLAIWGVRDPAMVRWLDPPPARAVDQARRLLRDLGAIAEDGTVTKAGRAMAQRPLHPRLAHMVTAADAADQGLAAQIAGLLSEPGLGGRSVDLRDRLRRFQSDTGRRARQMRKQMQTWLDIDKRDDHAPTDLEAAGRVLALAYPDRIAQARGLPGSFRLANGRGAALDPENPLAGARFLTVAEVQGTAASGRITLAAPIDRGEIENLFADRIKTISSVTFDTETGAVRARRRRLLEKLVLEDVADPAPNQEQVGAALLDGIRTIGIDALPWTAAARYLRARIAHLRAGDEAWPDLTEEMLTRTLKDWLGPFLTGKTRLADITAKELDAAIEGLLPWSMRRDLDRLAPSHFETPAGSRLPIDYGADPGPRVAVRVQEVYGLTDHPVIAGRPLVFELLSPARRPIQVTTDLPGFWRGSWADVRADMKARYPKHDWPAEPQKAVANRNAGRRRPR